MNNLKQISSWDIGETLYWLYPSELTFKQAKQRKKLSPKKVFISDANCEIYDMTQAIEMSGGKVDSLNIKIIIKSNDENKELAKFKVNLKNALAAVEYYVNYTIDPTTGEYKEGYDADEDLKKQFAFLSE